MLQTALITPLLVNSATRAAAVTAASIALGSAVTTVSANASVVKAGATAESSEADAVESNELITSTKASSIAEQPTKPSAPSKGTITTTTESSKRGSLNIVPAFKKTAEALAPDVVVSNELLTTNNTVVAG
jgi:hypothetical protein